MSILSGPAWFSNFSFLNSSFSCRNAFFFLFKLLTDFELSDIDGFGVYNLLEETEVKHTTKYMITNWGNCFEVEGGGGVGKRK